MSIDKEREEFEKFRDERNALLESEGKKPGSKWHVTNAHYPTWQASRAAIEVELPKKYESDYGAGIYQDDDGDLYLADEIVTAIEATGIKVK